MSVYVLARTTGDVVVEFENRVDAQRWRTAPGRIATDYRVTTVHPREVESLRRARAAEVQRVTDRAIKRAESFPHTWSVERIASLIEVVGLPTDQEGRAARYREHDVMWNHRGRDSAARYMYERLHPEHFANTRDVAA